MVGEWKRGRRFRHKQPKLGECWLQEDNKMNVSCTIEWKCVSCFLLRRHSLQAVSEMCLESLDTSSLRRTQELSTYIHHGVAGSVPSMPQTQLQESLKQSHEIIRNDYSSTLQMSQLRHREVK